MQVTVTSGTIYVLQKTKLDTAPRRSELSLIGHPPFIIN
jgi:hypothetical protein